MSFVCKVARYHPTWLGAAAAGLIASSDSLSHQATPSQTSKVDTIFCLGITLNIGKLAKKIGEVKNNYELARVGVVTCQAPQLNQVIWGEESLTSTWGVLIRSEVGVILLWSKYWNNHNQNTNTN